MSSLPHGCILQLDPFRVRITDSVTISSTLQQPWRRNKREEREWEDGREMREIISVWRNERRR
jgi:hypothetical protein